MRELPKICNRIKQDLYNLYKYVQDNIGNVIASLDDYGLGNKRGDIVQGAMGSSGSYNPNISYSVMTKEPISCSVNDIVTVKCSNNDRRVNVRFFNGSTLILASDVYVMTSDGVVFTAPANTTSVYVNVFGGTSTNKDITPETVGRIGVYINNEIDEVKSNLIKTQTVRNSITVGANSSTSFNVLVDDIGTTIDKVISFDSYPNYDANSSNLRIHVTRFNAGFNVQVYNSSNNEISNSIASVVTFLGL